MDKYDIANKLFRLFYGKGRRNVTNTYRNLYRLRDAGRCAYCGKTVEDDEFQLDHIIPVAKGGTEMPFNLTTSCAQCNKKKSAKLIQPKYHPPRWRQYLFGVLFIATLASGETYSYPAESEVIVGGNNA